MLCAREVITWCRRGQNAEKHCRENVHFDDLCGLNWKLEPSELSTCWHAVVLISKAKFFFFFFLFDISHHLQSIFVRWIKKAWNVHHCIGFPVQLSCCPRPNPGRPFCDKFSGKLFAFALLLIAFQHDSIHEVLKSQFLHSFLWRAISLHAPTPVTKKILCSIHIHSATSLGICRINLCNFAVHVESFKEQCKIPRRLFVWPEPKVWQQTTQVHSTKVFITHTFGEGSH